MDETLRREIEAVLRRDGKAMALASPRRRTGTDLNAARGFLERLQGASGPPASGPRATTRTWQAILESYP